MTKIGTNILNPEQVVKLNDSINLTLGFVYVTMEDSFHYIILKFYINTSF